MHESQWTSKSFKQDFHGKKFGYSAWDIWTTLWCYLVFLELHSFWFPFTFTRKEQHEHFSKPSLCVTWKKTVKRVWNDMRRVNGIRTVIFMVNCHFKRMFESSITCVHVWRDLVIWNECMYGVMHGLSMHFLHVCVCEWSSGLSIIWKQHFVMMSGRQRERAQTSKLNKQDTLHTHTHTPISQYSDRAVWALCVCFCMCEVVCFACQWLALLLCIFGCCGDNVATGDISFELTHTSLSLSFSVSFSIIPFISKIPW